MAITNHFIGEDVTLTQNSLDGFEVMEFNVMPLTQDQDQSLFTMKIYTLMPMSVTGEGLFHMGK
jgi:hypothetical protein